MRIMILSLILYGFSSTALLRAMAADDPAAAAATSASVQDVSDLTPPNQGVVENKKRRPKGTKDKYQKSKLTSDFSEETADHRSLVLEMGVDKVVDLNNDFKLGDRAHSIMEGNTNLVKTVVANVGTKKQLIFKALGEGETNVMVRDADGNVRVIFDIFIAKQNLVRFLERLREKLRDIEGITINIEDQKIVIRGEVLSPNDYGLIVNELADKTYGDVVINKATMSTVTLNALAKKIESDVQIFAPTVKTNVLNGKIIMEGSVESAGLRDRCLRRAEWYLPTVRVSDPIANATNAEKTDKPLQLIQSDIQVTPPPPKRESKLLRITVYYVELTKDFLKAFGFKWQPGFTADPSISIGSATNQTGTTTTSGSGGFTFSGTLSSLFPALNAPPSSASFGRILKTGVIVVKSADKGYFSDIESIPTLTLGANGTTGAGAPSKIGLTVAITPTILQAQDVDLNMDIDESKSIGQGAGGQPITASRHVTTRLYLKSGETAAVTEVNSQDMSTTFNRDDANPGTFGANATGVTTKPIFTLQRSKNSAKNRGQFVIFVSPQVIESAAEGTEDLKKNFRMKSGS